MRAGRSIAGAALLWSFCAALARAEDAPRAPESDYRTRVTGLLAHEDTLGAMELLEESALDRGWSDSLLGVLAMPDDAPHAAVRGPSPWRPSLRIESARVPSRDRDGFWSSSAQMRWTRRTGFAGFDDRLSVGARLHGILDDSVHAGVEPRAGWTLRKGNLELASDGWLLFGSGLESDAGFGADVRVSTRGAFWYGAGFDLSAASSQEAFASAGLEGRAGSWSAYASLRGGWLRQPLEDLPDWRMLRADSIRFIADTGSDLRELRSAWMDGRELAPLEQVAAMGKASGSLDDVSPDRIRLRLRALALREEGAFQFGPGIELDLRASTGEDAWLPGARDEWAAGTGFLLDRSTSSLYAVGVGDSALYLRPVGHRIVARYACLRIAPELRGRWRSRDRSWQGEIVLVWNEVATTDPGHPLEDDRQGFLLRLAAQRDW